MGDFKYFIFALADVAKEIVIGNDRGPARVVHVLGFLSLLLVADAFIGVLGDAARGAAAQPVPVAPAQPPVSESRVDLAINAPATVVVGRGVDGHVRIRVDPAPAAAPASSTATAAVTADATPAASAPASKGGH